MAKSTDTFNLIKQQGFLPLYFYQDANDSIEILKALYNAGIKIVEYTNRGEEALNNFKKLIAYKNEKIFNMQIGAGTIKNIDDAKKFIDAGADFIVCPGVNTEIGEVVLNAGLLWVPGCMTSTEIMLAENSGATLIKLFPAFLLKPVFVFAVKEIFPNLNFLPTGGVQMNKENIQEWFNAGVCAVGTGSKLFDKKLIVEKKYAEIGAQAKSILEIIQSIRKLKR